VFLGVAIETRPPQTQAGQAPARQTRLVVVGDSDFAANYSANIPGNAEMFLSIVRWLAQEKVAAIPSRVPQERMLTMTDGQRSLLSWFALLLLPGMAIGVAAYLRKPVA
jgi:ABC-type uncharacterized transport system involved in gliding motility auxiliary subunit